MSERHAPVSEVQDYSHGSDASDKDLKRQNKIKLYLKGALIGRNRLQNRENVGVKVDLRLSVTRENWFTWSWTGIGDGTGSLGWLEYGGTWMPAYAEP